MSILLPHDPAWRELAAAEMTRWRDALGTALKDIQHIGSTAVSNLPAKPIIDLLPIIAKEVSLDQMRKPVEAMGYEWMGEFGLPGRRYCRKSRTDSGQRLFHAHAYVLGSAEIKRHIAFRDWLSGNAANRDAYAAEKMRCAVLHPRDIAAYGQCKSPWIEQMEVAALDALA